MKKFVSILISLALVFTFASIGLFAEPDNSTAVQYSITPSYVVVIPQTVQAGDDLTITANSMNLEPGKRVVVRVSDGITAQSSILLYRLDAFGSPEEQNQDGSNVLTSYVVLNTGVITADTHIAEFYENSTQNQITHPLEIADPYTEGKLAGNYEGRLTFSISYEWTNPV